MRPAVCAAPLAVALAAAPATSPPPAPPSIRLTDVGRVAGLDLVHDSFPTPRKHLIETMPGGVALQRFLAAQQSHSNRPACVT